MSELTQCIKDITNFAIKFKLANPQSDGQLTWNMVKLNYNGQINLFHITLDKQYICQLLFFMIMKVKLKLISC